MQRILLFRFSQSLKPKDQDVLNKAESYVYARSKLDIVNNPTFIKNIKLQEARAKPRQRQLQYHKFPLLLVGASLFIYHLWTVMPYNLIFKHVTVSSYMQTHKYAHPVLLAPLSFQTYQSVLLYLPLMAYSIFLNGTYMNHRVIIFLFLTNAVFASLFTYAYGKYQAEQNNMTKIAPKSIGSSTALMYMSAFTAINPMHLMLKQKLLPFYVIPMIVYMNELSTLYRQ